jgi:hypothetical protein
MDSFFVMNKLNKLSSKKLVFGSSYKTPIKECVPIFRQDDSNVNFLKQILVSTPVLQMPWNITYTNDEKSFNIEVCNLNNSFIDELESACNKIITKYIKKYNFTGANIYLENFKEYPNFSKSLRFYNVRIDDIAVYDDKGHHDEILNLKKDDSVKMLILISSCWLKSSSEKHSPSKVGIDLKLVQIMRLSPYANIHNNLNILISEQSLKEDNKGGSLTKDDHNITKFSKMIKVGISPDRVLLAIKNDISIEEIVKTSLIKHLNLIDTTSSYDKQIPMSQKIPAPKEKPPLKGTIGIMSIFSAKELIEARANLKKKET